MNKSRTSQAPAEMAGLAFSDEPLHVSHLINEFCDGFLARIYKEESLVMQQQFERSRPFVCEGDVRSLFEEDWHVVDKPNDWYEYTKSEWETLQSLQAEAQSDWEVRF
jgi:hypothetical protein